MKKKNKKYYKHLDILRVFACLAILLYHLNILKGGYLAVCTFFVLSGYLSCISAFQKDKFSFKSYYYNRLLKLYIPLFVIVFVTIAIIAWLPNISWLNLKPETTSILLGYNNFWQLNANLDYFARNISSPFIHLWYISILLQFDLIFPFLYSIFRKIGDKVDKLLPCSFLLCLSLIGSIYFYKMCLTQNIMLPYYHTLTRIFSILFGVSLGFIHHYYDSLVSKNLKKKSKNKIFYSYLVILMVLFVFVDAKSNYFPISIILTTIITGRLIDYSILTTKQELSTLEQGIKCISTMSYEIYLVQYPIIFLLQYVDINPLISVIITVILTFILAYLFHFCLDYHHKNLHAQRVKYILCVILGCIVCYGFYQYCITKDYTEEMKQLKQQINQNKELMQQKQESYNSELKKEQEVWNSALIDLENIETELPNMITNLPIVGIGDSVMLGAINNLYQQFPKGYFDAKISRSPWIAKDLIKSLNNKQLLGDAIVINLGTNGDCSEECKIEIMKECEGKEVFWVTIINDSRIHMNDKLKEFANKYPNLHIIDWYSIAQGHPEYFYVDGIHLTEIGRKAYTNMLYDSIYQVYLEKYQTKKQEIMDKIDATKIKINFYGNDILLNVYETIQNDYQNARFIGHTNFTFSSLKEEIQASINDQTLPDSLVFTFDKQLSISHIQYQKLIDLCENKNIYILSMDEQTTQNLMALKKDNVTVIPFYPKEDHLMADKIHLTESGNKILQENLKNYILGGNI